MSKRTFMAKDLVVLPRLKARELLAIARALVLHARAVDDVPKAVLDALREVEAHLEPLAAELAPAPADPEVPLRAATLAECNAVGALVDFVTSWTRLPEGDFPAQVATARACQVALLEGAGLEFLTYKPLVMHSEVQRRMDTLRARKLDDELRALGGGDFLVHLTRVHKVFGAAAGATARRPEVEAPAVREHADALTDAVRTYVVRVVASIDRKHPDTARRADDLLQPLRSWSSPAAISDTSTVDPEGDARPAQPVTPAQPVAPVVPDDAPANDAAPARKTG